MHTQTRMNGKYTPYTHASPSPPRRRPPCFSSPNPPKTPPVASLHMTRMACTYKFQFTVGTLPRGSGVREFNSVPEHASTTHPSIQCMSFVACSPGHHLQMRWIETPIEPRHSVTCSVRVGWSLTLTLDNAHTEFCDPVTTSAGSQQHSSAPPAQACSYPLSAEWEGNRQEAYTVEAHGQQRLVLAQSAL